MNEDLVVILRNLLDTDKANTHALTMQLNALRLMNEAMTVMLKRQDAAELRLAVLESEKAIH